MEQEPGPRGSPHEPHGPIGTCVSADDALAARAANVECRRSRDVPRQEGHSGVSLARDSHSKRWLQVVQAYSNSGIG
jgi:hypothetical protein